MCIKCELRALEAKRLFTRNMDDKQVAELQEINAAMQFHLNEIESIRAENDALAAQYLTVIAEYASLPRYRWIRRNSLRAWLKHYEPRITTAAKTIRMHSDEMHKLIGDGDRLVYVTLDDIMGIKGEKQ